MVVAALSRKYKHAPREERFWRSVSKADGCWEWQLYRLDFGHGLFNLGPGKKMLAHRYAWELTNGPIPPGMCVCHHCDNPPCCNPSHLFLGTKKQNGEDMVAKGRSPRGTARPNAKLNERGVAIIQRLRGKGLSSEDVAWLFDVSRKVIEGIWAGTRWTHVREAA